jgi:hypothetical protein
MPPMPIKPPPWCRTFSDRYVSRATLTLGMGAHSFDPSDIQRIERRIRELEKKLAEQGAAAHGLCPAAKLSR